MANKIGPIYVFVLIFDPKIWFFVNFLIFGKSLSEPWLNFNPVITEEELILINQMPIIDRNGDPEAKVFDHPSRNYETQKKSDKSGFIFFKVIIWNESISKGCQNS